MQTQSQLYPTYTEFPFRDPLYESSALTREGRANRTFNHSLKSVIIREDKKYYEVRSSLPRIDHDRLFKELFQNFFAEFIQLFFPQIHELIDYTQLQFLSQEVFTDVTTGEKREVDILAQVKLKGEKIVFLIHVENQSYRQEQFAERMFIYYSRLYEKYRTRILPIALFSHDDKREEPDQFALNFPFYDVLQFQFLKLELRKISWRTYIRQDNPVAAALLSTMGYSKSERVQVKKEFLRMLVRLKLNPAQMQLISGFFDNYLQLNEKEELRLNKEIKQLDRDEAEAVFRIEPMAMRKGRLEGRKEGLKEGELRKEKELIRGMLAEGIDVEMISRISKLSVEEIERIRKMNPNNG